MDTSENSDRRVSAEAKKTVTDGASENRVVCREAGPDVLRPEEGLEMHTKVWEELDRGELGRATKGCGRDSCVPEAGVVP